MESRLACAAERTNRQLYHEACPFKRPGHEIDPSLMILDDLVADAQPQTLVIAPAPGGKERVEDLVVDGRVDAATVVVHFDLNSLRARRGANAHRSSRAARIQGIGDELENELVDLG